MILNKFEFVSMNNPLKALLQEYIEVKEFRKSSLLPEMQKVLEIGCGNGWGTKLIKKYFNPSEIEAVDLDPKMISIAQKNNKDRTINFSVADATTLPFKDKSFDAIFDFGIIHHIPDWEKCLVELKRVLKPGGELLIEDGSIETFTLTPFGKILKNILAHPYKEMYTRPEFVEYLKSIGFSVTKYRLHKPLGIASYFTLVAHK